MIKDFEARNCSNQDCKRELVKLIRVGGHGMTTMCDNPKCFNFLDLSKVDGWQIVK